MSNNTFTYCFIVAILLPLFSLAQDFTLQNKFPVPINHTMGKVAIDASGQGYAFGNCGMIYNTSDFGQTWNNEPFNSNFLSGIEIAPNTNGNTALIVGITNLFLTKDGGQSWEDISVKIPSNSSGLIRIAHFFDANTFVIVTSTGFVWKTTDLGENWSNTPDDIGNGWLFADFIDQNNGWLITRKGRIAKTNNGGVNWDVIFEDDDFITQFDFVDNLNGYKSNSSGVLSQTTDGGVTWTIKAESDKIIGQMIIRSAQEFWFLYNLSIHKTFDGGATWSTINLPAEDTGYFNGFVLQDGRTWLAGRARSILYSPNGNDNWTHQINNFPHKLNDIVFINESTAYAVGNSSVMLKSTDGGVNWNLETTSFSDVDFYTMHSPSSEKLLVGTETGIYEYSGSSFNLLYDPGEKIDHIFSDQSGQRYYAISSDRFYFSADQGQSWLVRDEFDFSLSGYDTVNNDLIFLVGENGKMAKSSDGGFTWQNINTGLSSSFKAVDFTSVNHGVFFANDSISVTQDGGQTFSRHRSFSFNPYEVQMLNELEGWGLSGNSSETLFFFTEDGGVSWKKRGESCQPQYSLFIHPQTKDVWTSGAGGDIICGSEEIVSSVDQTFGESQLLVYPNPTNGLLKIEFPNSIDQQGELFIMNVMGEKLLQRKIMIGDSCDINLNGYEAGYYVLALIVDNKIYTEKVILVSN